ILGIGLAAFFLMPLIARINESLHIHDSSIGLIALPWNLTLANVMPEVFPLADWTPHYYTVTLILGIMGCALSWRTRSNRRAILFFAVYGVIFYLKVYGFPLVSWIGLLPGYNQILLYKYPIPSISFCLAILAGFGLDRILRTSVPRWLFLLIPILVGGVVAGAWINPSGLVYDPAVLMRQSLLLAEITLLTGGLIYAVQLPRWKNLRYGVSMTLLVILVIEAANSSSWIVRPQRYDPYTIPPFVSYLNAHRSEPERIFGFDGIIIPELAAVYELDDIRFNSALLSIRRYLYIAQLLAPGEYPPTFLMHPGESVTTAWPDRIGQALSENRIQDRNGFIDNFSRLTGLEQPLYTGTYLDLLNVAKILTTDVRLPSNVINLLELPINREAIDASPRMSVQDLTITGDTRHGILISPPAQTMWSLIVPAGKSQLRLGVGLNPAALKQIGSLGGRVAFRVTITDATGEHAVFSADLDSRQPAKEGRWIDQSINLSQWSGQQIQLRLTVTGDSAAGLAFWSAPIIQLENRPGPWVAERLRDMHEIQLLVPLLDQSAMRVGPALSGSHLMIDTTRYQTLAMQPENLAEVDVHLPDQPAALQFAIGADSANGIIDGVHYAVRVIDGTTDTLAFEYTLRPSILENDRHWISVSVDLTPWRGRAITLKLVTSGSSDRSHLAHWANPRIVGAGIAAANPNLARFRLEYDNEVQIYDNAYAYPRAFVVNQVERVANIDQAINQIVQPAFDPSLSAVVEAPAADVEQLERPTITTLATPAVHVIANTTDSITLQTRLTQPGWLVLSETYNPNWQATVDGKPATISPTNIFLQGVALTPGEHQIVFRYRSKELFLGMYVSLSVLLLLMIGLTIWWCLDRRREHRNG
ncbi:MAG: YfhO family protein, partial [Roseiflexaceae bacterium]|nr:YfhO family protein [Roseiflexaceae bacterium]